MIDDRRDVVPVYTGPTPCPCGGRLILPADARRSGQIVYTRYPEKVRCEASLHSDDCRWSDQELPLDFD